jgi:hypothetical protein
MIGGMVSSTILTLLVIPAIYGMWRWRQLKQHHGLDLDGGRDPADRPSQHSDL